MILEQGLFIKNALIPPQPVEEVTDPLVVRAVIHFIHLILLILLLLLPPIPMLKHPPMITEVILLLLMLQPPNQLPV